MGESSKAVGLIPGGIVRQGDLAGAAGEGKGLVVLKRAVLILSALNPHLAALLSAILMVLVPGPQALVLFSATASSSWSMVLKNPIFMLSSSVGLMIPC